MDTNKQQFSLDELCQLTNIPKRTVRFYIQQELVNRPIGEKRAARYDNEHLEQLLTIRKWQDAGLSLARISEILKTPDLDDLPPPKRVAGQVETWSHMIITDGLELHINTARAELSPETSRQFLQQVMQCYNRIVKENHNE